MSVENLSVAFSPDEFKEYSIEFTGVIVRAEFGTPWTIEGSPFGEAGGPRVRIEIMPIDQPYENMFEWYPPSDKKPSKWMHFIEALYRTGAQKDLDTKGLTVKEKLENFCKSLVGMKFNWVRYEKLQFGGGKQGRLLVPIEYYGKVDVSTVKKEEIKTEDMSSLQL